MHSNSAVSEAVREWNEVQKAKLGDAFKEEEVNKNEPLTLEDTFISHVRVPTREEVEQMLVEKRKQVRAIFHVVTTNYRIQFI
jgi:hypothetical protein